MDLKERVGAKIKKLRTAQGLTQEALAELIDRSVDAVSQLERGINLPSLDTLERLSERLGVPVRDLFDFGEGEVDERRASLMASLVLTAKALPTADLAVAVKQVQALAERDTTEPPAQANGKASK